VGTRSIGVSIVTTKCALRRINAALHAIRFLMRHALTHRGRVVACE